MWWTFGVFTLKKTRYQSGLFNTKNTKRIQKPNVTHSRWERVSVKSIIYKNILKLSYSFAIYIDLFSLSFDEDAGFAEKGKIVTF